MTWEMLKQDTYDSGFSAGEERGISLGEHKKAIETAKNMRFRNIPIDVISECTGLSIEVIQDLADK